MEFRSQMVSVSEIFIYSVTIEYHLLRLPHTIECVYRIIYIYMLHFIKFGERIIYYHKYVFFLLRRINNKLIYLLQI